MLKIQKIITPHLRALRTVGAAKPQHYYDAYIQPLPPKPISLQENNFVCQEVNKAIQHDRSSPKFAIAQIGPNQYKFTEGDLVKVMDLELHHTLGKTDRYDTGKWLASPLGQIVILNKIVMVGSENFTLLGRPVLEPTAVKVKAVVVEKTRGHSETQAPWAVGLTRAGISRVFRRKVSYLRILKIDVESVEEN